MCREIDKNLHAEADIIASAAATDKTKGGIVVLTDVVYGLISIGIITASSILCIYFKLP